MLARLCQANLRRLGIPKQLRESRNSHDRAEALSERLCREYDSTKAPNDSPACWMQLEPPRADQIGTDPSVILSKAGSGERTRPCQGGAVTAVL